MNCSYKILNVEIVSGNELCSYWKSDMQEITTDKGKFIDNLAVKGGYDWKQEVGKTVYATVNKSKGYNWLSMEKHQSIQNNEIHIATKNKEIQEEKLPKDYNLNDNPELKQTYEYIKQDVPVIFLTGICLTGGAGTGKSTFIKKTLERIALCLLLQVLPQSMLAVRQFIVSFTGTLTSLKTKRLQSENTETLL